MSPLEQFICDTCGKIIETPDDGWVEWLDHIGEATDRVIGMGYRICHDSCSIHHDHPDVSDHHLSDFVGDRKWGYLFGFLDQGRYVQPDYLGPEPGNMREFTEFFMRLTVPDYEEARQYFSNEYQRGAFDDMDTVRLLDVDRLRSIIRKYATDRDNG